MSLTQDKRKRYRSIGHNLNPVVIVSENGLTANVIDAVEQALFDHELIKVKVNVGDREDKKAIIEEIIKQTKSTLVQSIGKMILILKENPKAKEKLSNIKRPY
ncbi:MAG: ribosome assembly RNA-binding protein YhbY [Saccharospirillaceae bacterium]|nr:ribosome assembly RNA-binding protein YhbY [Pseudomonadales bacterium]NRB78800.1 ribosome assembly RNA-binding protein YhbY [Saccharospirillaceae bacterium]